MGMTKITTDFVGTETTAVTKQRLTSILAYWGASTAAYTTWGQARTALNALLTSTTAGTIGATELAGTFLPKINFLNDPDDMVLDALFGAGEQGVWFDPSDVANLAWRRNLLTYTEQFDNAAWLKYQTSITGNSSVAPDGSTTGDKLVETTATDTHIVYRTPAALTAASYTLTVYAKAAERSIIYMRLDTGSAKYAYFDLTGGTVLSANAAYVATITSAGSGWYRCSITTTATSANHDIVYGVTTANNVAVYAGDGTSGVLIWGAQLEQSATATDYQRITDVNTEVIERFPNATMYQDAAGTTPVTTPGQPIGLRLDKSKGLVLGPEQVTDGGFSGAGWTVGAGWAVAGGKAVASGAVSFATIERNAAAVTAGRTYQVTCTVSNYSAGQLYMYAGGAGFTPAMAANGTFTFMVVASGANNLVALRGNNSLSCSVDDFSVKELPGNHATQSTAGSRLTYGIEPKGGRRNLLLATEDLTTAGGWSFTSATSVGGATDPDGGTTAFTLTATANNANILRATNVATIGIQYANSFYIRRVSGSGAVALYRDTGAETAITLTSSWARYSNTWTATGSNGYIGVKLAVSGDVVQIWHPQAETGSTATAYQRVTTAFDVTEAGVNTCHYCQYDGSDDGMITNSIDFTGTDKMSVFAGVRKLSDATAYAVLVENSAQAAANPGTFTLMAPFAPAATYAFTQGGSNFVSAATTASFAAPRTDVLTSLGDISGDLVTLRVNGIQVAQNTGNQGSGNFGNYPLFLGRRNNGATPPSYVFNGRDYGILITGKLANATAIATTEMWLANKTAGVNL
jgi:hypothetical protein